MSAMALKRISQETFDDVIRENVEDFEMEPKEALEEAIKQFQTQGVDLTAIDLTGGVGRADMEDAMTLLKEISSNNEEFNAKTGISTRKHSSVAVLDTVQKIDRLCDKKESGELFARNRSMMNPHGLNSLQLLMESSEDIDVLTAVIKLLNNLSKHNVEMRDFFEPGGSKNVCKVVKIYLGKVLSGEVADLAKTCLLIRWCMSLAKTVSKSENNKVALARSGMIGICGDILTTPSEGKTELLASGEWIMVVHDACHVMRGLCIHDDMRREMSCAMDNGRAFLSMDGIVPALMALSANFEAAPASAGAALAAAKTLVTTEDAVKVMANHGAMDLPAAILSYPLAEPSLVRFCLGLMRNLCADDLRKDRLVQDGSMRLTVAAMSSSDKNGDVVLMDHGAACLAAMSLRSPQNAYKIAETGAILVLVAGMRKHPNAGAFQRQCCLCMRNIAARCDDLRSGMLDAGCEQVLRTAGRIQEAVDEAYAALRDLGCEVHKVKIGQDGTIEAAYETFGDTKASFKAVYDDGNGQAVLGENNPGLSNIEQRVAEEAHAPFEGGLGQGASRPFTKKPFADEEIQHYGDDDDLLGLTHGEHCDH